MRLVGCTAALELRAAARALPTRDPTRGSLYVAAKTPSGFPAGAFPLGTPVEPVHSPPATVPKPLPPRLVFPPPATPPPKP